ncbi:MAG: BspA family leucine-rich repeat surface protein [Candidatus Pacebacteria bacterium]|jgi:surface protein|nr:BspA family leucine-rich repeat surface protein [Candidatus Paceibacterota bacterium]
MYKFFPISIIFAYIFFVSVSNALAAPIVAGSFSTTWDTGGSLSVYINLGSCPSAVYWEEIGNEVNNGTTTSCENGDNPTAFDQVITFPSSGQYRIDFTGAFTRIELGDQTNRDMFRSVMQWGDSIWTDLNAAFRDVTDLSIPATDAPDLSSVTSLNSMFLGATNFNSDINHWDVSTIVNMGNLFSRTNFNQSLDNWDVSNVTSFNSMFKNNPAFNQPLNNWTLGELCLVNKESERFFVFEWLVPRAYACVSGIDMEEMFSLATAFNQPLNNWDVSAVEQMLGMFYGATSFNSDISTWDVSSVESMVGMFQDATAFNQPLNNWDVSGASELSQMFQGASAFDQDLSTWQIGGSVEAIFTESGLSTANYSKILIRWSELAFRSDVDLGLVGMSANPTTYCDTAQAARDILTNELSWDITDGGVEVCPVEVAPSGGGSSEGTKVGIRSERLQTLRDTLQSTTTPVAASINSFVATVKNLITYLTENEEEIANLTPEESKQLIVTLRDALLWLLRWVPGV